jgi:hypothetical protein
MSLCHPSTPRGRQWSSSDTDCCVHFFQTQSFVSILKTTLSPQQCVDCHLSFLFLLSCRLNPQTNHDGGGGGPSASRSCSLPLIVVGISVGGDGGIAAYVAVPPSLGEEPIVVLRRPPWQISCPPSPHDFSTRPIQQYVDCNIPFKPDAVVLLPWQSSACQSMPTTTLMPRQCCHRPNNAMAHLPPLLSHPVTDASPTPQHSHCPIPN